MARLHCRFWIAGITLIAITVNIVLVGSESTWTKKPPALVQVEIGSNAVLKWDYDLKGRAVFFARWGRVKGDRKWDKSYIMRGKDDLKAEVVAAFASKVQWIANATMVIMNASLSDSGKYGCSIDLDNGETMESFTELEVLQLIKANQSGNQLMKPPEGSRFSLQFDTLANYQPKVLWFKDGVQLKQNSTFNYTVEVISIQSNQKLYRFTLLKQVAHRNDSGFYEGFVEFVDKHVLIRNFTLIVQYSPENSTRFYTSTGSNILLEGSNASLICDADSNPAPIYEIRKFSTSLSNNTAGHHVIPTASPKDEGEYFCTPRNEVGGGTTESIHVQIGTAPIIRSASVMSYVAYGENIMLRCTITAWPIPLVTWLRNGGSLRSSHKVRNITNNKEIVSEVEISKAEKADIGNYSCIAENMFDRRSIDISLAVLMLVWSNSSFQKGDIFTEGSNFSISYDVQANLQPNVSWFKDGQRILSGFNMPIEVAGGKSNLTLYRITLAKNNLKSEDSGIYHAKMAFGSINYNMTSFSIKVEALKSTQEQQKDTEFDTWLIPIIIGTVSILLLAVAVFCGVLTGRRYRTSDPESNLNDLQGPTKSSMRSGNGQSVTAKQRNGISNVAFEGESRERAETKEDEGAQDTNTDFNRDSIYRFTVNPMFSSPEEEHQGDIDDQYLPFRHVMYFPTNAAYETTQAEITFGSEGSIEEQYLSSPPNTEEGEFEDTTTNPDEAQMEMSTTLPFAPENVAPDPSATPEGDATEPDGALEPEIDATEEKATIPQGEVDEDVPSGDEMTQESQEEDSTLESDTTDHLSEHDDGTLNESWNLPLNASKFEESTSSFDMYISEMFDFRTSSS